MRNLNEITNAKYKLKHMNNECKNVLFFSRMIDRSKEPPANQTKQNGGHLKEDENQNTTAAPPPGKRTALLNDDDNIPLIDVQSSTEGNQPN